MPTFKRNDQVVCEGLDALLTVRDVDGEAATCAWVEGDSVKIGTFKTAALSHAPQSLKSKAAALSGKAPNQE
ncbi:MAG: hypothetical protein KTR21_13145 [Rhodobacteraceae bacterium]|nr:hypothetical protein [Paracoccaceae bacterium]